MARAKTAPAPLAGWGHRFLACVGLTAGLAGASLPGRAGLPAKVTFRRGAVEGLVEDRAGTLYDVEVRVRPLAEATWKRLLAALCADPDTAAALAQGRFGAGVDAAAKVAEANLFDPLRVSPPACTCPRAHRCSHVRATLLAAALQVEQNPFLWLEVLGRSRREVLAHVYASLGTGPAGPPLDAARFWAVPVPAGAPTGRTGSDRTAPAAAPAPPSLDLPQAPWAAPVLAGYLEAAAALAREVRDGTRPPVHLPLELPGEPMDLAQRLVPEVAQAVQATGTVLHLTDLAARCPTAAALPPDEARMALAAALTLPIPGAVGLGYGYAATRPAALAGAAFRHVVSFWEWYTGHASDAADWVGVLRALGHQPPYPVLVDGAPVQGPDGLLAHLRPEVGDEIWIEVVEAEPLRLLARRVPRAQRDGAALEKASAAAAQVLVDHMDSLELQSLAAPEALAFLLGAGYFRPGRAPDVIWLLPEAASGHLGYDCIQGRVVRGLYVPPWPVDQRPWSWWPEQERLLKRYRQGLVRSGTPKAIQWGLAVVDLWLRRWPAPHDQPRHAPGVGPFLAFLWIEAPVLAARSGIPPEAVPELLDQWLAFLAGQDPALAAHYAPHRAACGLVEAYRHRCATLSRQRKKGIEEWQREGYRWLGADLCFARQPAPGSRTALPPTSTREGRTV